MLSFRRFARLILPMALAAQCARAAAPDVIPLSEIEPGMRGMALTVLGGTEPDSLPLEILGVFKTGSPNAHVILVKGLGEFAQTGIARGMSGSPVFIGDRLMGALAFAFTGATEPLGGVTPFGEMESAMARYFEGTDGEAREDSGTPSGRWRSDLPAFPEWRDLCARGEQWDVAWPEMRATGENIGGLVRLDLPLSIVGGSELAISTFGELVRPAGLVPVPGGGAGGAAEIGAATRPLAPGDALAVDLISGDMQASVIGTVTWVSGDQVYAFGHPFLLCGATELPVSRARIHTIIPTRSVSFKIGSAVEEIGTLIADRSPGVGAVIGRAATTVPLDVHILHGDDPADARHFHFELARHEMLTPPLMTGALAGTIIGEEFSLGIATIRTHVAIDLDDGRRVEREDLFRSINPAQTAGEVMAPASYLIVGTFDTFPVKAITVTLRLDPELRAVDVSRIRLTKPAAAPGDDVSVAIYLREHRGEERIEHVTLRVPPSVLGQELNVMVGSATAFYEWDRERAAEKYRPWNLDDLIRLIEEYPSEESLIVRLYGPSRGIVVRGRELPSLPLSKWRTLRGAVSGGEASVVHGLILDEVILKTGDVILGGTQMPLRVAR